MELDQEISHFDKRRCINIPSKGGLSAEIIKQIATHLGIPINGTKAFLCEQIEAEIGRRGGKAQQASKSPQTPNIQVRSSRRSIPVLPKLGVLGMPSGVAPLLMRPSQISPIWTVQPAAVPKPKVVQIEAKEEKKVDKLERLYLELDGLITTNSENFECCIAQYQNEIELLEKKKLLTGQTKKTLAGLRSLKVALMDKFFKKYQDFYFEYLHLLMVNGRQEALRVLQKWIPQLNKTYTSLLHDAFVAIPPEILHYLFPPNYLQFEHYEEKKDTCKKYPRSGISTLLCFRSYMMQFISRLVMLSKQIDEQVSKGSTSDITKMLENEVMKLNEIQKYLDGVLLCRTDYCDEPTCTKKKRLLRGSTCEPRFAGFLNKDFNLSV